jgi:ATP-dependent Clp protease ATP-binding subunit ClpA
MFERYTDKAGRVIFFARYEASRAGSPEIGDEHLLTGLLIEDRNMVRHYLGGESGMAEIRAAIAERAVVRKPTPRRVDLPLSQVARQILAYAAEEATRLGNEHIGTEHLLLGILREEKCLSARLLREQGVTIRGTRAEVAEAAKESESGASRGMGLRGTVRGPGTPVRIVRVGNAEPMLVYQGSGVPLIGEGIVIRENGQANHRYRVKDVVWVIQREGNGSRLADVEVLVTEEDSNQG